MAGRLLALEPWRETAHHQLMLLLARSGQRSAALAQYETCRQILAEELGVEPLPETTDLYERLKTAGTPPPHNLPPPPNTFVGRETELSRIVRNLADPGCRLLTIVGSGGIGKTRLALETARYYIQTEAALLEPDVADGVYVVSLASMAADQELSGLKDLTSLSNAVVTAVADALGFSFHGTAGLKRQLLAYLRPRAMLLVLDNFEQLLARPQAGIKSGEVEPGVDLVIDILQQALQIKLLVTSRERLNLREEWAVEVAGLDYPGRGKDQSAVTSQQLSASDGPDRTIGQTPPNPSTSLRISPPISQSPLDYSAIALFVQRAQQTMAGFTLSEAELPHVARLCQLVEGTPLAVELAASWLRALSCAEIVAEIERSLDFLATSLRNMPVRHRSLRAVFERSWEMLSRQEQAAFARLSIFRGGFSREAAAKVAETSLATLVRLVDKSLLRRRADGRYELHELVRQYAAERLWTLAEDGPVVPAQLVGGQGPALVIWQDYSAYYLNFVAQREGLLSGSRPQQALAEIRAELDNIRQAWQWAVTEGSVAELEQAVGGLARFYDLNGLFQEGEAISCYRVLRANRDPRAEKVLATAHRRLQARAANIEDERLRRSFLENVAPHRELVREFQNVFEKE